MMNLNIGNKKSKSLKKEIDLGAISKWKKGAETAIDIRNADVLEMLEKLQRETNKKDKHGKFKFRDPRKMIDKRFKKKISSE